MKKTILRRAALAAAISTTSSGAMAAGFYLNETSISGLGRAFAAENTVGDNAAILARNPAGSALFDTITLSGGVIYVNPEIDAEGDVTYFAAPDTPIATLSDQKATDYAPTAWVPNAYLAVPFNENWSFGLAMYSNYGLETDFDSDWPVTTIADKTELLTVNIAPSVAYDFNDQFSIGFAVNFLYADATLKTMVPTNFGLNPTVAGADILSYDDADDWEVSWTIGALWNITDRTRFGISYHAELDPELEGDVNSDLVPLPLSPFNDAKGKVTLDLPDTLELGLYHRFNENWGLALGALWTDWDDFERLEAFIPAGGEGFNPLLFKEENFQSGWRYSIAGEYYPCEEVTLRIGYAYDEGAARDGFNTGDAAANAYGLPITWRTLSIPDTDRNWVTIGGTYKFNNQLSIDGGLAYLWGDDETIQEFTTVPAPTYFDGRTTNIEAWLAGVSLNYAF
ncbi:outer membrane protein transport protein [Microbulbifer thermotolerans]|uniref:OmpP1/FadL family transporter n=1 Tax=Microbulbifer thermotolerans TaxID=252514 RepID=UPI00224A95F4|nr:outer membrane protein transport protein [Microbulbifer thermotolerans]MCX2841757.1 outer membrane protein transport protein [Microbulbifer thermotolerans]